MIEKINILPQYIFKFKSDEHLLNDTLLKVSSLDWKVNQTNYISKNNRLNQEPQFEKLHQWFYDCLKQVCDELKYDFSDIIITQSWANKSEGKMWHHGHTHINSLISGIYYLTDSDANTWFSTPNIWSFNEITIPKISCEQKEIIHKQPSQSGVLILFPSTLYHSVDDLGKNNRYTISFNTFPSGMLGNFEKATGADIKIFVTNN